MNKFDFLQSQHLSDTIGNANIFAFNAQYGYAKFIFRADTLSTIEVFYSEGD